MLKIIKKMFHKKDVKDVYDYLTNEDKIMYDKICRGIPAGNLNDTIAFLDRLEQIKQKEGIK